MPAARTLTHQELRDRLTGCRKGDQIIYHVGSLMRDRAIGSKFLQVHAVATVAWAAYEDGKVTLVQRVIVPGVSEYIAIVK